MYAEWVPNGWFVKGTILSVSSAIMFVIAMIAVFMHPLDAEATIGIGVSTAVLGFILLLFLNYRGIKIQINSNNLSVKFGLFNNKSIKLDEIVACKTVKSSFSRYGGAGIRYGFDGSQAYTTSLGNAVEVTSKQGRIFVFSSNKPRDICQIINTKIHD
ncbi:MAG: hypothetical protein CW716_07760 [Candidatus Bathyarchaeum sp.]|nr:MAG: hypothetical protein CW716_07760 [Candidatus Bathyarchaeum sp.]